MNEIGDESDSDYSETQSVDSCEAFIHFESIRDPSTQLEEGISLSWPGIYDDVNDGDEKVDSAIGENKRLRKLVLSTQLEEEELAPLFGGCQWAGTRLWGAAVRCIQYISGNLVPDMDSLDRHDGLMLPTNYDNRCSMLELGCGLGVPGMIYHLLGGNVVLTDQIDIISQLEKNVKQNFPRTAVTSKCSIETTSAEESADADNEQQHTIQAMPLSWSRDGICYLLQQLGRSTTGFDIVINCDCVFEPLYGKSWHLLNETIDELLKVNPQCIVVSSMERRGVHDGIDAFVEEMRDMDHVGSVDRVWCEEGKRKIEIYITRGIR